MFDRVPIRVLKMFQALTIVAFLLHQKSNKKRNNFLLFFHVLTVSPCNNNCDMKCMDVKMDVRFCDEADTITTFIVNCCTNSSLLR